MSGNIVRKVYQKIIKMPQRTKPPKEIQCERCVVCHCLTDVPVDQPVSERKNYVSGAGQLCEDCCMELYHTSDLRDGY